MTSMGRDLSMPCLGLGMRGPGLCRAHCSHRLPQARPLGLSCWAMAAFGLAACQGCLCLPANRTKTPEGLAFGCGRLSASKCISKDYHVLAPFSYKDTFPRYAEVLDSSRYPAFCEVAWSNFTRQCEIVRPISD